MSLPRVTRSRNERRGGGSSPSCASSELKATEFPFNRHGVPVLNRPTSKPSVRILSLKLDEVSPIRPPGLDCSPTWRSPRRNVPAPSDAVQERKAWRRLVSLLRLQRAEGHRIPVQSARRSSLKSPHLETQRSNTVAQA